MIFNKTKEPKVNRRQAAPAPRPKPGGSATFTTARALAARILVAVGRRGVHLPRADTRDVQQGGRRLVLFGHRRAAAEQGRRGRRVAGRPAAVSVRTFRVVVGVCRRDRRRLRLPAADTRRCRASPSVARDPGFRAGPSLKRSARVVASLSLAGLIAERSRRRIGRRHRAGPVACAGIQRRHARADRLVRDRLVASHRHVVAPPHGTHRRRHRKERWPGFAVGARRSAIASSATRPSRSASMSSKPRAGRSTSASP